MAGTAGLHHGGLLPGRGEPCSPADGEEWTLALFATDDNWFSGGDVPDTLPNDFTAFLIGFEFNSIGEETGLVIAPLDSLTLAPVPLPAAFWLFASSLGALGVVRRARQH
ncbi:VPLPA-CTERM sorting domain-containing protein [Halieaceae bacterium IMCC14734]|uniref:VPLPA-CTERM sorting domain-containing protein n=1 Tax=Candidatus Litorirhabdus singularis TaxID=2518993 RepID=A0ABT3TLT4_9GAMM|nr:VPLPA-CTERM sorting domain-containing protein [Candidatus Litorirhabdus singularis]